MKGNTSLYKNKKVDICSILPCLGSNLLGLNAKTKNRKRPSISFFPTHLE